MSQKNEQLPVPDCNVNQDLSLLNTEELEALSKNLAERITKISTEQVGIKTQHGNEQMRYLTDKRYEELMTEGLGYELFQAQVLKKITEKLEYEIAEMKKINEVVTRLQKLVDLGTK